MCAKIYQNITCEWACVSIITYFLLRNNQPVQKNPGNEIIASNKEFPVL